MVATAKLSRKIEIKAILRLWKIRFQKWIHEFFPRDTGIMQEAACLAIDNAQALGASVYFDLWQGAPEYAKYVDRMQGVNWTNPNTQQIEGNIYLNGTLEGQALWEDEYNYQFNINP